MAGIDGTILIIAIKIRCVEAQLGNTIAKDLTAGTEIIQGLFTQLDLHLLELVQAGFIELDLGGTIDNTDIPHHSLGRLGLGIDQLVAVLELGLLLGLVHIENSGIKNKSQRQIFIFDITVDVLQHITIDIDFAGFFEVRLIDTILPVGEGNHDGEHRFIRIAAHPDAIDIEIAAQDALVVITDTHIAGNANVRLIIAQLIGQVLDEIVLGDELLDLAILGADIGAELTIAGDICDHIGIFAVSPVDIHSLIVRIIGMDRVADRTVEAAELHIRADLDAEIEADSLGTVLSGAFGQEIFTDRRGAGKCKADVRILFCHVKTPLNNNKVFVRV